MKKYNYSLKKDLGDPTAVELPSFLNPRDKILLLYLIDFNKKNIKPLSEAILKKKTSMRPIDIKVSFENLMEYGFITHFDSFTESLSVKKKRTKKVKSIEKPLSRKRKKAENENWIIKKWNEIDDVPSCRALTEKRKKALSNIEKKYSIIQIDEALSNVPLSHFLLGKNQRGWKADIDFFLREDQFVKILEGKYLTNTQIQKNVSRSSLSFVQQDELRDQDNLQQLLKEVDDNSFSF